MNLSPGERVRSMLAVPLELQLDGERHARHVVLPDGSVLLRQAALTLPEPGEMVLLSGTDVASVAQPDRIRGGFSMRGTLTAWEGPRPEGIVKHLAGPEGEFDAAALVELRVIRFQPSAVSVSGRETGWTQVDLPSYAAAAPDPLVAQELRWLPHLQRDHWSELRSLAVRAYPALDDSIEVRALSLDRYGMVLRLYAGRQGSAGHLDCRVGFPDPATCACEVRQAFAGLLGESRARLPVDQHHHH